jgi:hypothetical protein
LRPVWQRLLINQFHVNTKLFTNSLSTTNLKMAVQSMASALAALAPAVAAAPTQAAPTYEAIPSSMAKLVDIEADITLQSVQLDGMVCVPAVALVMRIYFDCETPRSSPKSSSMRVKHHLPLPMVFF